MINIKETKKLFLGGLHEYSKKLEILEILKSMGINAPILDVRTRKKKDTVKCLGYAILKVSQEDNQKLLEIKQFLYMGQNVTIVPFMEGNKLEEHLTIFSKRKIFLFKYPDLTDQS